jgi:ABC-type sugar transport system ATPase subunit
MPFWKSESPYLKENRRDQMEKKEVIIRLENVRKSFSGVPVLKGIDMTVYKGEALALIGENGAGKSTLMKILAGAYSKDEGRIFIDEEEVVIKNPMDARSKGVSIIYQELSLIPTITAAENVFLGRLPKIGNVVDWKKIYRDSASYFERIALQVNPKTLIRDISIAQRQMVEIARALSLKSKIVIMDEPTSSLADTEVAKLFEIINQLKAEGVSVIYISHKLEEVLTICDRVTVLKDGALSGVRNIKDTSKDEMVSLMVGRDLDNYYPKRKSRPSREVLLEVKNLKSGSAVKDVSFTLHKGEVLGLAGLVGAGRTETMRAIFGADKKDSGQVFLNQQEVHIRKPKDAIRLRIAFATEDRRIEGLVMKMSVKENTTLANFSSFASPAGIIDLKKEKQIAKEYVEKLRTRTDSINKIVMNLSGGNQQKVVISKWLNTHAQVYIFDEPTRGIDVGAKAEIYQLMINLAEEGCGVIMVSSELPEVMVVSDRILVMHEGQIAGEVAKEEATEESIMAYAVGGV